MPACHLHCARGPAGGRISPWRDLWGRPPRRAAGRFPAGPAGAAAEPWAAPRSSPALRPQARPALTDLEAIAGSRRCRETTCPCLLRREAPWAQGRAAGAQRRAPAPAGHRSETPGPGEQQGSAGRGAEWGGGVGRGVTARALRCAPPRPLASALPFTARVWASGCCRGLCQHQGRAVLLTRRSWGWLCAGSVPRRVAVSIPCRACSGPGVAAVCVWVLPCLRHVGSSYC